MFSGKEKREQKKREKEAQALAEEHAAQFIPVKDDIRRALSAVLTQDEDTSKLFKKGRRTYFKLFGGSLHEFISVNTSLINASLLLQILETLERIETKLNNDMAES